MSDATTQRGALCLAAFWGDHDACVRLLAQGADQARIDPKQDCPELAWHLREEASKAPPLRGGVAFDSLRGGKGSSEAPSLSDGATPLMIAALKGHAKVCSLLLDHGATHAASKDGCTPLFLAAARNHGEVCSLLVARGADLSLPYVGFGHVISRAGVTPLLWDAGNRYDRVPLLDLIYSATRAQLLAYAANQPLCGITILSNGHYPTVATQWAQQNNVALDTAPIWSGHSCDRCRSECCCAQKIATEARGDFCKPCCGSERRMAQQLAELREREAKEDERTTLTAARLIEARASHEGPKLGARRHANLRRIGGTWYVEFDKPAGSTAHGSCIWVCANLRLGRASFVERGFRETLHSNPKIAALLGAPCTDEQPITELSSPSAVLVCEHGAMVWAHGSVDITVSVDSRIDQIRKLEALTVAARHEKERAEACEKRAEAAEVKVREVSDQLARLSGQLRVAQEEARARKQVEDEATRTKDQLRAAERKSSLAHEQATRDAARAAQAEVEVKRHSARAAAAEAENERLRGCVAAAEAEVKTQRRQATALATNLADTQTDLAALRERLARDALSKAQAEEEASRLREQLSAAESVSKAAQEDAWREACSAVHADAEAKRQVTLVAAAEAEAKRCQERAAAMEAEVGAERARTVAAEERAAALQAQLATARSDSDAQREALEKAVVEAVSGASHSGASAADSRRYAQLSHDIAKACRSGAQRALEAVAAAAERAAALAERAERAEAGSQRHADDSAAAAEQVQRLVEELRAELHAERSHARRSAGELAKDAKATAAGVRSVLSEALRFTPEKAASLKWRSGATGLGDVEVRAHMAPPLTLDDAIGCTEDWPACAACVADPRDVAARRDAVIADGGVEGVQVLAGVLRGRAAAIKVLVERAAALQRGTRKALQREAALQKLLAMESRHVLCVHGVLDQPEDWPLALVMEEAGAVLVRPSWLLMRAADAVHAGEVAAAAAAEALTVLREVLDPRLLGGALSEVGVDDCGDAESGTARGGALGVVAPLGVWLWPLPTHAVAWRSVVLPGLALAPHGTEACLVVRSVADLLSEVHCEAGHVLEGFEQYAAARQDAVMEDSCGAASGGDGASDLGDSPLLRTLRAATAADSPATAMEWLLLPLQRRLLIALGAARGLAELHAQGVMHRDVKPDNLMVGNSESGWWVRVGDFGDARHVAQTTLSSMASMRPGGTPAAAGRAHGTPAFMAPEAWLRPEAAGTDSHGLAADVYSFGCVLLLLMRADLRHVWERDTHVERAQASGGEAALQAEIRRKVCAGERPHVRVLLRAEGGVPGPAADRVASVAELVEACWLHDPEKRPAMQEVATRLLKLLESEREHFV